MTENIIIAKTLTYGPTFAMLIIFLYDRFRKPEVKLEKQVAELREDASKNKVACKFRHASIDDNILLIKENHLKHIEEQITSINEKISVQNENIVEIKTTLKERAALK